MRLEFLVNPAPADVDAARSSTQLFPLLALVQELGSLQRAAQALGLSYRHAWGLVKAWEADLGQPLLAAVRGRGAALTDLGQRMVAAERQLRAQMAPAVQAWRAAFDTAVWGSPTRASGQGAGEGARASLKSSPMPIRVAASYDALLEAVTTANAAPPLALRFCSAVEALASLHERQADLAGFSVARVYRRGSTAHVMLRRWLRPGQVQLIRLAGREQGLLVAPPLAAQVRSLRDLARRRLRLVNRQRSSAARWLLDEHLTRLGLYPPDLRGYDQVVFSQEDAAQAVLRGEADATVGSQALAEQHGLHFVPLAHETYYLAYRRADHATPWIAVLRQYLGSAPFRALAERFAGYSPAKAGRTMTLQAALPWYAARQGA